MRPYLKDPAAITAESFATVEREARLDVVLGLTPEVPVEAEVEPEGGRRRRKEKALVNGWQGGEWGGWECYMAPHEEEDDPV